MAKWKDLTKKERQHLKDVNVTTLWQFKDLVAFHQAMRAESGHNPVVEPCWECRQIANKLGLI